MIIPDMMKNICRSVIVKNYSPAGVTTASGVEVSVEPDWRELYWSSGIAGYSYPVWVIALVGTSTRTSELVVPVFLSRVIQAERRVVMRTRARAIRIGKKKRIEVVFLHARSILKSYIKSKIMYTVSGKEVHLLSNAKSNLENILWENRGSEGEKSDSFFDPKIADLHDPFLLPDMSQAVDRILLAREKWERIVIFWDYDVDGVSSTAILVRYLTEIGCQVSYRLPHRVHDGYGLKSYFFDELASKEVRLVITVDCGTRDIGPIRHAKSLGIDVIVTDHHAVPDIVPDEVIAIINPKRWDSKYPFRDLAGAGVAFKLLHAIAIQITSSPSSFSEGESLSKGSSQSEDDKKKVHQVIMQYIDFAALGTVSDCMPIVDENRTIVSLGLKQMSQSRSHGLRKFLSGREKIRENDADLIGFQIGPRINAAGRMDTPITALQWLLAGDERSDSLFEELEHMNETRKWTTDHHFEKALNSVDTSKPILIYDADDLEHGIIGLVAGKLTEMYGKPSIILKNGHDQPLTRHKGDEVEVNEGLNVGMLESLNDRKSNLRNFEPSNLQVTSIASCRSPEWCNMIELLDRTREYFVRYGGHRQAAGFTIETGKLDEWKEAIYRAFSEIHDIENLPKRKIEVECILNPVSDLTLENIAVIDRFRPFGIGNRKPLFLFRDETILEMSPLGKEGKHLQLRLASNPKVKLIAWGWGKEWRVKSEEWKIWSSWEVPTKGSGVDVPDYIDLLQPGNIVSLIVELDENEWNNQKSVSVIIKDIIRD
jgi:single-stranded-DNA-specific exonuclease